MYKILDTKNNKSFKPELIGSTLEGEKMGEYIKINDILFLSEEVQEIAATKEIKVKTNKTNVINSIQICKQDRSIPEIKEIIEIKSKLKKKTKEDVEGIQYWYNNIINLYHLSAKGLLNSMVRMTLKDAVKEILKSSIVLDTWEYKECKQWAEMDIL